MFTRARKGRKRKALRHLGNRRRLLRLSSSSAVHHLRRSDEAICGASQERDAAAVMTGNVSADSGEDSWSVKCVSVCLAGDMTRERTQGRAATPLPALLPLPSQLPAFQPPSLSSFPESLLPLSPPLCSPLRFLPCYSFLPPPPKQPQDRSGWPE